MSDPAATKALILAGGLGTRLQALVSDRPKPMAEAAGKPFLEYLIEQLRSQGFQQVVLCLGHLAEQVQGYFGSGQRWGLRIDYSVETQLLGTAGALGNARRFIDGAFLVLNGDSYLEADLRQLLACHARRTGMARRLGSIAATWADDAARYGTLKLGRGRRILGFQEKAQAGAGWINAGAYVLEPEVLDWIPTGQPVSIERQTFPLLLERGYALYACPLEGFFVDIGTPEGYAAFQHYIAGKQPDDDKGPSCRQECNAKRDNVERGT